MKPMNPNTAKRLSLSLCALLALSHNAMAQENASGRYAPRAVAPKGELQADERSTIDLFERSKDSVVYITTQQRVMDPWSRNVFSVPQGTGTGFVWDDKGHLVTNYHVIDKASEARIRLADGRELQAKLVGASPNHDLAVLKISVDSNHPPALPIGSSHDLKVGQKVLAIGNPFGLDMTLTTGIVSALDRSLTEENGTVIEHLIQTDAAINPGNSGGPLLDSSGRLMGINTAIYSPSGASSGVGFAVPVDTVNRVVPELIARGKYARPTLGIRVDEGLNKAVLRQLGVQGVLVLSVNPGSPAEAAGLQGSSLNRDGSLNPGDVILAVGDKPVDGVNKLLSVLDGFQIGSKLTLKILRKGEELEIAASLQAGQ